MQQEPKGQASCCALLASDFSRFAAECGGAIWENVLELEGFSGREFNATGPETVILSDVCSVISVISRAAGHPSIEIARLLHAVSVALAPDDAETQANDYTMQSDLYAMLGQWESRDVEEPLVLTSLAEYDETHDTGLAPKAARIYRDLVYVMAKLCESSPAAASVANRYDEVLDPYLSRNSRDRVARSDTGDSSLCGSHAESCSECAEAYRLLELPFGADSDDVTKAQRELARNLHPDTWGQKRGVRLAEEQLSKINAACDHLFKCRLHNGGTRAETGFAEGTAKLKSPTALTSNNTGIDVHPAPTENLNEVLGSESAFKRDASSLNVQTPEAPVAWRYTKVILRTIWRLFKLLVIVAIGALVLIGIVAKLADYFKNEVDREKRGTLKSEFKSFTTTLYLSNLFGIPLLAVRSVIFFSSAALLTLVLAGQAISQFCLSHWIETECVAGVAVAFLVLWALSAERCAEFTPPGGKPATTVSWVMGLLVLFCGTASYVFLTPVRLFDNARDVTNRPVPIETSGRTNLLESKAPLASSPASAPTKCDGATTEGATPLWNGYSLHFSQNPAGCTADLLDAAGKSVWSKSSVGWNILPVSGEDINGDAQPELVLQEEPQGSGGFTSYLIATLNPLKLVTFGDTLTDFERDPNGGFVLHTFDRAYSFFEGSGNADSPVPDVFLKLEGSEFHDVGAEHWSEYDNKIKSIQNELTAEQLDRFRASDGRSSADLTTKEAVLRIVLEYLYGGKAQQAWDELARLWPESDQARIRAMIQTARGVGVLAEVHGSTPR